MQSNYNGSSYNSQPQVIKMFDRSSSLMGQQQNVNSSLIQSAGCQQQGNIQLCPHRNCQEKIEFSLQKEKYDKTFYFQTVCNGCKQDVYYFPCKCGSLIISNFKFIQGYIYKCPNQIQCTIKQIQLIICGKPGCHQVNMFTGNYKMGALIQCVKCQTKLQQLGCPHCQKSMYFIPDKPYQYAKPILCYNCQSGFQHFNCGRCNQPQFSRGQKFNPCQPQICNLCMLVTYILNCPSCKIAQFRQEYHPFKVDECQNQKCKKYHSYFECPGCKKLNEQVYAFREMENGRKQCQHCKLQFTAFECVQCKNKVIQNKIKEEDIYDNSKINVVCQKCNNNQLGVYCCNCKTCFGVDDVFSKTATCDTCKTENVLKLGKESDAKLGASQLKMEKKSSGVVQDDRLLCKICQDKQANHIFINCGHLVTCDDCSKLDLKKTCPLCRTKGECKKIFF